jgi:hypothetical protein
MIITNKAKCRVCEDVIESKYTHDFVLCKCGSIFVDGGHEYLHRGGNYVDIIEMSVIE